MKQFFVAFLISGFLYLPCITSNITGVAKSFYQENKDDFSLLYSMYSFAKQAKISAENSRNFTDFLLNIDPMIRLEKKAERRINEIMDLINGLKDMIHNLQFSVDIKYFNTQIKHPTKHLFQSVKRLLEYPSEYSKNALIQKCDDKSPLEILDVLNDVLSENWLIDQAAHVLMASPNVTLLIKKLDEIVEMLAISHAACSGAYSLEKLDFEKFTNISKKVFQQVERSKAFIHKNYLKFTESTVRKYLINFSDNGESDENKNYAKIANDLLSYFENFYNYGPLYTIGVSHMPTWFSNGMAHIGSEVEQSLLINEDSYSVYIILSPSLCDFHHKNETLSNLFESLINITIPTVEQFKEKCLNEFSCLCTPTFFDAFLQGIFKSNGGICRIGRKFRRILITKSFPQNFIYRPIQLPLARETYNVLEISENSELINSGTKRTDKVQIKYLNDERLFMENNDVFKKNGFDVKLTNGNMDEKNDSENFQKDSFILTTTTLSSTTKNNPPIKYSNFKAGRAYLFKGRVICNNGNPLGDDATVSLIEVDEYSPDDIFTIKLEDEKNGKFSVYVDPEYNDFPSFTLEFKLQFKNCCGDSIIRESGYLNNGTRTLYTLH